MNNVKSFLILILGVLGMATSGYSQDLKAGEINVSHISGLIYEAKLNFYYESSLFVNRPFILLNWGDGTQDTLFSGTGISGCGDSNTITKQFVKNHTYVSPGNYIISCIDSFRIANINNISNSSNEKLYLEYHLTIGSFSGSNTSPFSFNCATDQWLCCNWIYNSGCYDVNGDSLSYSLVPPFTSNYTFPPASINNSTGDLTFSPTATGLYAFCLRIDKWRSINQNSYIIGTTYRELLIDVNSLTSINENDLFQKQVSIYPNPNNGLFTLEINLNRRSDVDIQIYNLLGELVYSGISKNQIEVTKQQIDISDFSKGIYLVKVKAGDSRFNKKVVYK